MTCQTDDPEARRGLPAVRPRHRARTQAAPVQTRATVTSIAPSAADSRHDRYDVFDRNTENRRRLFREANIPLETEVAELEQQYQKTHRRR